MSEVETGSPRVRPLAIQTVNNARVLAANLRDVTPGESLIQPRPGGNCLNWVLGHVVANRNHTLRLLGREPAWPPETAERYARGSDPIGAGDGDAVPLPELVAAFERAQQAILAGLSEIGDEALDGMVPWFGGESTRLDALAFMVFHETYHLGQTGVLRRLVGKPGAIG